MYVGMGPGRMRNGTAVAEEEQEEEEAAAI